MTAVREISAAILATIKDRDGDATFAFLERAVRGFQGPLDFVAADDPNILLWRGLSPPAAEALKSLIANGDVHLRRSTVEKHVIDGRALRMPTTPRGLNGRAWRPVALFPGPAPIMEAAAQRMRR